VAAAGDPPLTSYRVVDLSTGIAGGYCTKVLADGGAEVVKLESPGGDPLRRWSPTSQEAVEADSAIFQFLACSKSSVLIDVEVPEDLALAHRLVSGADAVVWSSGADPLARILRPPSLRRLAPGATVVAISPFGLEGPWAELPATEATLQAWSGGPGQRGAPQHPPVMAGGSMGEWTSGIFAAVALLASRYRTLVTGVGELVDVSKLESLAITQAAFHPTFHSMLGRPWRETRWMNIPDIHRTNDGWVGFMVVTGQQWLDFAVMVEHPEWADDEQLMLLKNRIANREWLLAEIDGWMSRRSTAEVVELASLLRIPVAVVGNGATVPTMDHFVDRDFFVRNPRDGFVQPDVPYTLSGGASRREVGAPPRLGEHTDRYRREAPRTPEPPSSPDDQPERLPFAGLRVADFTAFFAGPFIGNVLGMLGADVIHVEAARRPDGLRNVSARSLQEDQWWEWAPLFAGTNTDKRGLTLDLQTDRGRELARALIGVCDVVVENYSPRVMENWGLDYETISALNPRAIMLRAPAFGLTGPWRDRVGFAQTMEQLTGLAWITGHPDDLPQVPNGPCDPIASAHALVALLLALEHRRKTGAGMLVEVAMVGGALNTAAEQIVDHSAYGRLMERMGNRSLHAAPQNFYRARHDRWVAISITSDQQWETLVDGLGRPEWADDPGLKSAEGRHAAADQIDERLAVWCSSRTADDVVELLWPAGVPVAAVIMPHEQTGLPQLQAREFFSTLDHAVTGRTVYSGFPAHFSSSPPATLPRRPPPTLGQDNHSILSSLLGLSDDEIEDLTAEGVIGTRPPSP
jgi:crotonobetainyl-CoA:carnitine CoA-transferase CaiB-like acyl-CoA transferase